MNKRIFDEVIEEIATERFLEKKQVKSILQESILDFLQKKNCNSNYIDCEILENGELNVFIKRIVVEQIEDTYREIDLKKASLYKKNLKIDDEVKENLKIKLEVTDIKEILQNLQKKLKNFQKEKEYSYFYNKIGTCVNGYIKKINVHEIIISFPEGEGSLKKKYILKNDILKNNTYIKLYLENVRENENNQIFLSRTHNNFVKSLMVYEIPEIKENIIEIKSSARDAGSKSKIAVFSNKAYINPKKICIGENGNRIKSIIKELNGEKIDIILWSNNLEEFIFNAFSPIEPKEIIRITEKNYLVVIKEEDFSRAMGANGQNVKLVKKLCNLKHLKLMNEEEKNKVYKEDYEKKTQELIKSLNIEEMMACLLINEGYKSSYIIANSNNNNIAQLSGFNLEIADVLITRAKEFELEEKNILKLDLEKNNKNTSLLEIKSLSNKQILILLNKNINSKNELALLDIDELEYMFKDTEEPIETEVAYNIIAETRNISKKEI